MKARGGLRPRRCPPDGPHGPSLWDPACQRLKGTIPIDCDGGTLGGAGAPRLVSTPGVSLTRSRVATGVPVPAVKQGLVTFNLGCAPWGEGAVHFAATGWTHDRQRPLDLGKPWFN